MQHINSNNFDNPQQSAYKTGHTTETALLHIKKMSSISHYHLANLLYLSYSICQLHLTQLTRLLFLIVLSHGLVCAAWPWSGSRWISDTDSKQINLVNPFWIVGSAVWNLTRLSHWPSSVLFIHHCFQWGYWNAPQHQIRLLCRWQKCSPGFWQNEFMSSWCSRIDVIKYAQIKPWQNRVHHLWISFWAQKLHSCLSVRMFSNSMHQAVVNNLVVCFDANFSFADHVHNICKTFFFQVCDLRPVKQNLPDEAAILTANALLYSRLD